MGRQLTQSIGILSRTLEGSLGLGTREREVVMVHVAVEDLN